MTLVKTAFPAVMCPFGSVVEKNSSSIPNSRSRTVEVGVRLRVALDVTLTTTCSATRSEA